MKNYSYISIDIHKSDEVRFLTACNLTPDTRYANHPTVVTLVFETFETVTAKEIHFDGIPFLAHYGGDSVSSAARMCGDGIQVKEFPCSKDTELTITLDDKTGKPNQEEVAEAKIFMAFESYCEALTTREIPRSES